jgi:ribosome assembly protein SQT1
MSNNAHPNEDDHQEEEEDESQLQEEDIVEVYEDDDDHPMDEDDDEDNSKYDGEIIIGGPGPGEDDDMGDEIQMEDNSWASTCK